MFSDITTIGNATEKYNATDKVQNGLYVLGKVEHDAIMVKITACGQLPNDQTDGNLWIFLLKQKLNEIREIIVPAKKPRGCASKTSFDNNKHRPEKDDLFLIYIHRNLSINGIYALQVGLNSSKAGNQYELYMDSDLSFSSFKKLGELKTEIKRITENNKLIKANESLNVQIIIRSKTNNIINGHNNFSLGSWTI